MSKQIMTVVTAVCYVDEGFFDYWVTQSDGGKTFELLGAKLDGDIDIASQLNRVIDRILEASTSGRRRDG